MNKLIVLMALCTLLVQSVYAQKSTSTLQSNESTSISMQGNSTKTTDEKFTLIQLPYATNALEPVISQRTVELHHGKHLQGYVNNLNKLIKGTPYAHKDLVSIVKESSGNIFNNAGQNLNHILYFLQFSPNGGGKPKGELAEGKPMILDFWATWCGPCQLIGPMIEELAEEFNGQIIIGKVDVDSNTDLPGQFGIRNIPTLIFIKNGEIQKKLVGAQQKSVLVEEAKKLLA